MVAWQMRPLLFGICRRFAAAGAVSPNKRKILLKTIEQLVISSIKANFGRADVLILMSSCIDYLYSSARDYAGEKGLVNIEFV